MRVERDVIVTLSDKEIRQAIVEHIDRNFVEGSVFAEDNVELLDNNNHPLAFSFTARVTERT